MRSSTRKVTTICVGIAIIHAVLLLMVLPRVHNRLTPLYNQNLYADGYDQLAINLLHGEYRFYPDTARTLLREPGYPLLLAGIFQVFGTGVTAVQVVQIILALLAALLVHRLAYRVTKNDLVSLLAPILLLCHPGTVIAESRGGTEILLLFLLVATMLKVYEAIDSGRPWHYVVAGVLLGLTVLVKGTPMLFPVALLAYLLAVEREWRRRALVFRNTVLIVCAMFGVLSPWIVRNYIVAKAFVPTASVLGVSAHAGQYLAAHMAPDKIWQSTDREAARERKRIAIALGYPFNDVKDAYYQAFYSTDDELKFSRYLLNGVITEYRKYPTLFAKLVGANVFNLWFAGKTWESTWLNACVQVPYLVLAGLGILASVKRRHTRAIAPLILLLMYSVGVYAVILAQARYSVPLIPFVSVLAAIGLTSIHQRMSRRASHADLAVTGQL